MNLHHLLSITLMVIACGVILWRVEPAINRMRRSTPWLIKLAFLLLAAGALFGLAYLCTGRKPSIPELLLAGGVAALMLCERRMRVLLPPSHHRQQRQGG